MVVDFDGRILAQADPGPGERIVVAELDLTALREARAQRLGHNPLAHLRTEVYSAYGRSYYPPETFKLSSGPDGDRRVEENEETIRESIKRNYL